MPVKDYKVCLGRLRISSYFPGLGGLERAARSFIGLGELGRGAGLQGLECTAKGPPCVLLKTELCKIYGLLGHYTHWEEVIISVNASWFRTL